jgi:hypothetical protein
MPETRGKKRSYSEADFDQTIADALAANERPTKKIKRTPPPKGWPKSMPALALFSPAAPGNYRYEFDVAKNVTFTNSDQIRLAYFTDLAFLNVQQRALTTPKPIGPDPLTSLRITIRPNQQLSPTTSIHKHFNAAYKAMLDKKHSSHAVTEATGEIGAALYMLTHYEPYGYQMVWGFGEHSGPGIDQIWHKTHNGRDYFVIVEAKGPTAHLNQNTFDTTGTDLGLQMSQDWIIDRLGRMHNAWKQAGQKTNDPRVVAANILDGMGVETRVPIALDPTTLHGSNSYYVAYDTGSTTPPTAVVTALTIRATWGSGPTLQPMVDEDTVFPVSYRRLRQRGQSDDPVWGESSYRK